MPMTEKYIREKHGLHAVFFKRYPLFFIKSIIWESSGFEAKFLENVGLDVLV